jgi:hypothetical protein
VTEFEARQPNDESSAFNNLRPHIIAPGLFLHEALLQRKPLPEEKNIVVQPWFEPPSNLEGK